MGSSAKKIYPSSRRLYYDGPLAHQMPTRRMGSYSAESAEEELKTPESWRNFRPRPISRPSVPPRRT